MAASGTLIADFVSQNSVFLIIAVVTTILLLALSTYFIARGSTTSSQTRAQTSNEENKRQTTDTTDADRSSASESDEAELTDREPGQGGGSRRLEEVDPVMYCEHIQGEIKRVKQEVATRKIRENLTPEQINQERIQQQEQLAEIFRLMQEQNERFGIASMDEMKEQMKLYGNF